MNDEIKIFLCNVLLCLSFIWFGYVAFYVTSYLSTSVDASSHSLPAQTVPGFSCLVIGYGRKCIIESPPPERNSSKIWAEFIGIGPARSGSSNLLWTLQLHPQIEVGQPELQNQSCCPGSELNFFIKDSLFEKGIEFYKGFFQPRQSNVRMAGEKTPGYSDNPLVPYRIRGTLGPNVKLLFTLRDPLEALFSLYTLRHQDERGTTITDYFKKLMDDQRMYDHCVETIFESIPKSVSGGRSSYYDMLSSLDMTTAMLVDEMIMECFLKDTSLQNHKERLQHYIYKENLMRWNMVMPNQVLCIWNDEFRRFGQKTLNVILDFLGVDKLPNNTSPLSHSAHDDKQQQEWKKQLGIRYDIMCKFLIERNRGIEEWCPRMWPGEWQWCADALIRKV